MALSAVEHSAVLHAAQWLTSTGRAEDHVVVGVDAEGRVHAGDVARAAAAPGVAVVALQTANHEVGTVQPVAEVAAGLDDVPLFVDACASMGRLPLPDGWAAAAGSAHKWGGPAGVGVLLVRRRARWGNPFPGDDRVDERATGFENVAAALAAAAALQAVVGRARRGQRPPARAGRADPRGGRHDPRRGRGRRPRPTGSPTWSRSPACTSTARRS